MCVCRLCWCVLCFMGKNLSLRVVFKPHYCTSPFIWCSAQSVCQVLDASVNMGSRVLETQLDSLLSVLHQQVRTCPPVLHTHADAHTPIGMLLYTQMRPHVVTLRYMRMPRHTHRHAHTTIHVRYEFWILNDISMWHNGKLYHILYIFVFLLYAFHY